MGKKKSTAKKEDGPVLVPEVVQNGSVIQSEIRPVFQSPVTIAQLLLEKNVDIEKIGKLIELQEKWDKIQAKKAYVASMAELKKNPPKILKDKRVHFNSRDISKGPTDYKHATFGNVEEHVTPWLASGGFSVSFRPEQSEKGKIKVTCTITHDLGHSEDFWLETLPDTSGNKNAIQAIGSTYTYLQRYTLLGGCGLATHDQDDDGFGYGDGDGSGDGKGPNYECINQKQMNTIRDLLADNAIREDDFLRYANVSKIEYLPKYHYDTYVAGIESKAEYIKKIAASKKHNKEA